MTVYGDETGLTHYEVVVRGKLANAPGIVDPANIIVANELRDQVTAAARAVVKFALLDFHVLYRPAPGATVCRKRWVLDGELFGPSLRWVQDTSGTSGMRLRLIRDTTRQQFSLDVDNPMPAGANLHDVMTAVLAKNAIGPAEVSIPLLGQPLPLTFTSELIDYTRNVTDPVSEPYTSKPVGLTFLGPPGAGSEPGIWVVPVAQSTGWKISACLDANGTRWDDPEEVAPAFEPLPAPTLVTV